MEYNLLISETAQNIIYFSETVTKQVNNFRNRNRTKNARGNNARSGNN